MSEETKPAEGKGYSTAISVVAAGLAILVVLLAWQNLSLKRRLAGMQPELPGPAFHAGDVLEPFTVFDADGAPVPVLDGTSAGTLLLAFTSTCPACRATLPVWRESARLAREAGLTVVGVRLDAAEGEDPAAPLPPDLGFPVYVPDRQAPGPLARIQSIPVTVLLDKGGKVRAEWTGTLDPARAGELTRALSEAGS